ncbi:DUF2634 domain-containing protein [Lactiplantibacillus plajomi]|uniref:DUF2634 domain-containing protein n=1 Tax=Lactiplantibacillus plajomi TaxID=1457217 RepID=A0ABV6K4A8_9LACO|nr:DUF2634 domain-containing protein [Lactiplantibacillus plajomi]
MDDENLVTDTTTDEDSLDVIEDEVQEVTLTSRTYKVTNGRIIGMTDDLDAMVQAIDKIMRTERFVFPIYSDQYGNDFEELLGKDFDYAQVEVERMLTEALEADDRVGEVQVDTIERTDANTLTVTATVSTVHGDVPIETEVNMGESGTIN